MRLPFFGLALCLAFSSAMFADTIVQTYSETGSASGSGTMQSALYPQWHFDAFSPALGTLHSVEVDYLVNVTGTAVDVNVVYQEPTLLTPSVWMYSDLRFLAHNSLLWNQSTNTEGASGPTVLVPYLGVYKISDDATFHLNVIFDTPDALAWFESGDTSIGGITHVFGTSFAGGTSINGSTQFSIRYNYSVPDDASSFALLAGGLLTLGLFRRIRA